MAAAITTTSPRNRRSLSTFVLLAACACAQTPTHRDAEFQALYAAGLASLSKGDPAAALPKLEGAASLQPRSAQIWLALTQTYFKLNKPKQASEAAVRSEAFGVSDPVVLHGLSFYYVETHDIARAAALEARYAAKAPQDPDALPRAVDLYLRAGKPQLAIPLAQKAVVRDSRPETRRLLAKSYEAGGLFPKAIQEYRQVLQMRPYDETCSLDLADAYLKQQKFGAALDVLNTARQSFDKSAQIEQRRAAAFEGLRRYPEAIDALLKTVQFAPQADQPYLALGRMIDQADGKMPDLTAALATYVSLKPDSYLSNYLYAEALAAQNADLIQVAPLLRRSISLNPNFEESHLLMSAVLEKDHNWAGSAEQLQQAVNLNPKDATAHSRLAHAYEQMGKKPQAAAERALAARVSAPKKAAAVR